MRLGSNSSHVATMVEGVVSPARPGEARGGDAAPLVSNSEEILDTGSPDWKGCRVKRCACKCRFCPCCAPWLGRQLRDRLRARVPEVMADVFTLTLTLDPELFESPRAAWDYVRAERLITNLVARLHRAGYLHSRAWFAVVEWQKNGMPHWHLVLDATYIPFERVTAIWDSYRPSWAGPRVGVRPGLGSCRFTKLTKGPAQDRIAHAINYLSKYLTKWPEEGFPDWVLDESRVRRFSTSRGFWGTPPAPAHTRTAAAEDDFDGDDDPDPLNPDSASPSPSPSPSPSTIRQRTEHCGATCNVFSVHETIDPTTGEVREVERYMGNVPAPLAVVAEYLSSCELLNWYCLGVGREAAGELVDMLGDWDQYRRKERRSHRVRSQRDITDANAWA